MGGTGSGRPPKNQNPENETFFEEQPITEKKPEKKATGKKFTMAEVREKIDLIFSAVARVTKRKYIYTEKDFEAEAAAVVRLAEKFPPVFHVLALFDPVLLLLGFWAKFNNMEKKEPQQTQQQGNVVPMQQAGVR